MTPYRYIWVGFGSLLAAGIVLILVASASAQPYKQDTPSAWPREWPKTDFERTSVDFEEIMSGGPPKDGIPAIDEPAYAHVSAVDNLAATEPVISITLGGETRAYPLRILMWHEIINDTLGGTPITVTFCPFCNSAIVFDGRVDGRRLTFGTTG